MAWLNGRVPQAKRVVITDTDASWGGGFTEEPESRPEAISTLADVVEDWASSQWDEEQETLAEWLGKLGPIPVVTETEWLASRQDA